MARFTGTLPAGAYANALDAAQVWIDGLTAMGWVQTADAGQLEPSTAVAPVAPGVYGYTLWEPGDGLGGLVLKIEFDMHAATGYKLRVSLGESSNGAGTLTGVVWAGGVGNGTSSQAARQLRIGGDQSGFFAAADPGTGTATSTAREYLFVDRSRNSAGEPILGGAALAHGYASNSVADKFFSGKPGAAKYVEQISIPTGGIPAATNEGALNSDTSFTPGNMTAPVFPVVLCGHRSPTWVTGVIATVAPADQGLEIVADLAGRQRTFTTTTTTTTTTISSSAIPCRAVTTGPANTVSFWPVMLWED